jgi:hypothetical protein
MLLPPVVPVIRFFLSATGVLSTVFAKSAQVLGFWSTGKRPIEDLFPEQQVASVSDSIVISEESLGNHDAEKKTHHVRGESQKVRDTGPIQKADPAQKDDRAKGSREHRTRGHDHTRRDHKATQQAPSTRRVT